MSREVTGTNPGEHPLHILMTSSSELAIRLDIRDFTLSRQGHPILRGTLGSCLHESPQIEVQSEKELSLRWPSPEAGNRSVARLTIRAELDIFTLEWEGAPGQLIEDYFVLASGGHWYGGAELVRQHWPLESVRWELAPYLVTDNGATGLGNVLHPFWHTSSGAALAVEPALPIIVGLNAPRTTPPERFWPMGLDLPQSELLPLPDDDDSGDGLLRLKAHPIDGPPRLRYTLSSHSNPATAQKAFLASLPHSPVAPRAELFNAPIWTTWARFKTSIDQKWTLTFAREIVARDFPRSVMEIDDRWSTHYGDLEFDTAKFPDPRGMVDTLHGLGFRVTLWVTPFAVKESAAFQEGREHAFWVRDAEGAPGFFRWWQGSGVALDVTNEAAVEWFILRLRSLQARYGIDGFKFDAGEPCFLPHPYQTMREILPNDYTTLWVEKVASQFEWAEVRSAYCNQNAPVLVREWDRYSTWGLDNGLQSLVTAALTLGTLGYPFVLPDMIGGNAYSHQLPDRELLIRWAQANALLPAMQFSIAPWDYDEETVDLCRRAVSWHTQIAPVIQSLAKEATRTGYPITRPLFWLAPDDPATYPIGDQFALGQDIVVAPVMARGARARDLYLPAGVWQDVLRGDMIEGARWLIGYPAELDHLPWFERKG